MKQRWLALSVGIMCWTGVAWSQDPAPPPPYASAPSCEVQVQEQYRKLTTDGLLTPITVPQWGPQFSAIIHKVRTGRNELELEKQQAALHKQQVAEIAEQLRLAREETLTLKTELDKLKPKPAPPVN